jgi:hypothetical protein
MKVFADLHHGDLYYSLHRLFEERLGFELYRPIGLDWFSNGFWKIAEPYGNAQDTINQYLDINERGYNAYENLNGDHYIKDGVFYVFEPGHRYHQRSITLETFKSMSFDLIISSISSHDRPYLTLRDRYQPRAKIIAHLGNAGQQTILPNVIYSIPFDPPSNKNTVLVHQELDPNIYFFTEPDTQTRNIYSCVNNLPFKEIYLHYKGLLTDCNFKAYGASSLDGVLDGSRGVGEKIREGNIGWQLKPLGGLGHTAMGWFYSGRPVITNMSENRRSGGEALALFEPGVTCLDIESHSPEENCRLIRGMLEDNLAWGRRARQRFTDIVNYDREEEAVRKFLERLI